MVTSLATVGRPELQNVGSLQLPVPPFQSSDCAMALLRVKARTTHRRETNDPRFTTCFFLVPGRTVRGRFYKARHGNDNRTWPEALFLDRAANPKRCSLVRRLQITVRLLTKGVTLCIKVGAPAQKYLLCIVALRWCATIWAKALCGEKRGPYFRERLLPVRQTVFTNHIPTNSKSPDFITP